MVPKQDLVMALALLLVAGAGLFYAHACWNCC